MILPERAPHSSVAPHSFYAAFQSPQSIAARYARSGTRPETYHTCWNSGNDGIGRYVFGYYRTRSYNCTVAQV